MLERMAARPVPWLLLFCAVNFMFMLGGNTLWDVDEPNNAVCAREMLAAGNWWVPVFNGSLRFDKPILLYWLMMPLFHVFGVHEWTARLPSAMAISALVLVVFYFGRRMADARTGLIAALLLVSSLHIVVIGRAATPDPLLMLCIGFALSAFLCFYLEGMDNNRLLVAAYMALGFGVLAKGPVAILLPALVMLAFLLMMGQRENIRKFRPVIGLGVILAVALPWYITVGVLTDGEWLNGFLLHHNIDRFTGVLQGHRGFPRVLHPYLSGWMVSVERVTGGGAGSGRVEARHAAGATCSSVPAVLDRGVFHLFHASQHASSQLYVTCLSSGGSDNSFLDSRA